LPEQPTVRKAPPTQVKDATRQISEIDAMLRLSRKDRRKHCKYNVRELLALRAAARQVVTEFGDA
jgi:hypothetical protein